MQQQLSFLNVLPPLLQIFIIFFTAISVFFLFVHLLQIFFATILTAFQKYSIENRILKRTFFFVTVFEIPVDSIKLIRTNRDKLLIGEIPRLEFLMGRNSLHGAPYVSITHALENKKTVTIYAYTLNPQKLKAMIRESLRSKDVDSVVKK
jgi:hypothetical protein